MNILEFFFLDLLMFETALHKAPPF
jgi:hypothetical protein